LGKVGGLGSRHGGLGLVVPTGPGAHSVREGTTGRESSHGVSEDDRRGGIAEIRAREGSADLRVVARVVVPTRLGIGIEVLGRVRASRSNSVESPVVIEAGLEALAGSISSDSVEEGTLLLVGTRVPTSRSPFLLRCYFRRPVPTWKMPLAHGHHRRRRFHQGGRLVHGSRWHRRWCS